MKTRDDNDINALTAEEQAALDSEREEAAQAREAPPEPAQEPEAEAPEQEALDERADSRPKMVPHAALHEERERRKEIERQTAEKEKQWEQRYNMLLQRFAPPQQQQAEQPPPLPDREKDPVGYLEALALEAKREAAAVQQALQQRGQHDQQAQVIATIQQHATAAEMQFRQKAPDYDAAVAHLVSARHRQLELAGYSAPADRQALIAQEAMGLAARAMQERRDPAEIIYALAKEFGYAPPQQTPQQQPDPEAQLQAVARGQQQARASLSSARGAGPSAVTGETIAKMTEEQFNGWYEKATKAQRRAVLGG